MEGTLKITKNHHKHLNNPFPSTPRSLPLVQGTLSFDPQTVPSHQIFSIGKEFQSTWLSKNGGSLSISHQSEPTRAIWSTNPGQAFVSAALAETEVEESRGSFVIRDRDVHFVCNHQIIDEIKVINRSDYKLYSESRDFPSGYDEKYQQKESKGTQFPVLLITGRIFGVNTRKKKIQSLGLYSDFVENEPSISAKYWVFFDQKSSNQIGFHVKIGKPNPQFHPIRRRIGWPRYFSKGRAIVTALEFIEGFTDAIGRPPELPEWIISGAVVGMQGGTDFVRGIWHKLQAYDVPVSAFWLQDNDDEHTLLRKRKV